MGKRGPAPKPDAIRLLEGSHLERINADAPVSPLGVGDPPDWLDDHGKEAWNRLVDRVGEMRLLTRADYDLLIVYAAAYSDFQNMAAEIDREGLTVKGGQDGEGPLKPHPLITPKQQAMRTMLAIMAQLGMSPSSRATLHAEPPRKANGFMEHVTNGGPTPKKPGPADGPKRGR